MFSQIGLKLWKDEYLSEWIIGKSNEEATQIITNGNGQIFLKGPHSSGKKHLAHKIAKLQNCNILITKHMSDIEIIEKYDEYQSNKQKVIWVESFKEFAKDSHSRFNSMLQAQITELSEDMFYALLDKRLKVIGFELKNEILNYCIYRIERTYRAVEECVQIVNKNNKANLKTFKDYFECM